MKWLLLAGALLATQALCACNSSSRDDNTTPIAQPTIPLADPTPAAPSVLSIGDDASLPAGLELFVETGCWQCSGGPEGLYRVGASATRRLAESLPGLYHGAIGSVDGHTLWVLMAPSGYQPCLDCSPTELTVFASIDGGDQFEERGRVDGRADAAVAIGDDLILAIPRLDPSIYVRLDGSVVEPPPGGGKFPPVAVSMSSIGWITDDRSMLVRQDGTLLVSVSSDRMILRVAPHGDGLIISTADRHGGEPHVSIVRSQQVVSDLPLATGFLNALRSVPSSDGTPIVLTNLSQGIPLSLLPAMIDMRSGEIHQFRATFEAAPLTGERNLIVGARTVP